VYKRQALYQASADLALPKTCADPQPQHAVGCQRHSDLAQAEKQAMSDLVTFRQCDGWSCEWFHVLRWGFILCLSLIHI